MDGTDEMGLMTGTVRLPLYGLANFPARTKVACAGSDRSVAVRVTQIYPIKAAIVDTGLGTKGADPIVDAANARDPYVCCPYWMSI